MTTYEQLLADLPEARRARVEARAKQLVREEKVRRSTTPRRPLAKRDSEEKAAIGSRLAGLESRGGMSVYALRRQVAAMGGRLRVMVEIKGRPPVELKRLGLRAQTAE